MGQSTYASVEPAFIQAQKEIQSQIDTWMVRVAKNNQVTMSEARKLLTVKELAEFQWDVTDYIKYGQANALDASWIKQLENASAKVHVSRLEALKISTQQSMEKAFGNELDAVDSMAKQVFTEDYYHSCYEIQKGSNIGWNIGQIDDAKLNKLVSKPWTADGSNFSDRIWQSKTSMVSDLHTELTRTCILGKSPDEAIKNMTKYVDGKFKNAKAQAGRLVMTEQAFFASAAQKEAFNDLDVEEFEIVATLDSRTSPICQSMDGQHFPMKDYQPGVTAPPFHPWCRSCTCPFFDDEWADGHRAARDDKTGQTYYVPSDTTYPDWKEKFVDGGDISGLDVYDMDGMIHYSNPKASSSDMSPTTKAVLLDTVNFPTDFRTKSEIKNTQKMCDFVNSIDGSDENVLELYSKMSQMESVVNEGIPFKISHASGYAVTTSTRTGKLIDVKLTIPKLQGDNLMGQINTMLHEEMHLMDLYLRDTSNNKWFTTTNTVLADKIEDIASDITKNLRYNRKYGISPDVEKLFDDFHSAYDDAVQRASAAFATNHDAVVAQYRNGTMSYTTYKKEYNRLKKVFTETCDYEGRNLLGGGVGNLEDIYDALSKGYYRDCGFVKYGHGSKYYSNYSSRAKEVLANYGSLSVTRPDLIEILRADKPELVQALDDTIKAMLKGVDVK